MNCQKFLAEYTEYRDGELSWAEREAFDAHVDECESCARYDRVVRQGTDVFRHLPEIEVSDDFGERLQHRLWHVEEEMRAERRRPSSGAATATLSMAAMIALAAWVPLMRSSRPVQELPAVAAKAPARALVDRLVRAPEATGLTSTLAELGVAVREMPYHDVVFHGDGPLVHLAAFDAAGAAPQAQYAR